MDRAYREDELLEATVIDSEGYIYGRVGKINVDEDKITLIIYESKPDTRTVVDVDALKEELLKNVNVTVGAKLQRLLPREILLRNMRRELGLEAREPLTDQHYLKYAERLGIPISHKRVKAERKEPKGSIDLHEIKTIRISMISTGQEEKVIKIIILRDPREAMFRRIPVQEKIPYRDTKVIQDKLVLDASSVALGYVDSVVFFRETPGIRVYLHKTEERVDMAALRRHLDETGKSPVARIIERYFTWDTVRRDELEVFMQKTKLTFTLPDNLLLTKQVKKLVMDVPWEVVHKIGDVVMLRLTLPELRSKGYFIK